MTYSVRTPYLEFCAFKGQWECHIQPNWLLVWEQNETELILILVNTGTHSDLFGKNKR